MRGFDLLFHDFLSMHPEEAVDDRIKSGDDGAVGDMMHPIASFPPPHTVALAPPPLRRSRVGGSLRCLRCGVWWRWIPACAGMTAL